MRPSLGVLASLLFACSSRPAAGNYDTVVPDAGTDSGADAAPGLIGGGRCPMPATVHAKIQGFVQCKCLNGTFALFYDESPGAQLLTWKSAAIDGCAAQTFVRLSNDPSSPSLSIENMYGQGDEAPATAASCAPLSISGGGSTAGNISFVCPSTEDEKMTWSITP